MSLETHLSSNGCLWFTTEGAVMPKFRAIVPI